MSSLDFAQIQLDLGLAEANSEAPDDQTQAMEVPKREELRDRTVVDKCFSEVRKGNSTFYTCKCCRKPDFRKDSRKKHLETHVKALESGQFIQVSNLLRCKICNQEYHFKDANSHVKSHQARKIKESKRVNVEPREEDGLFKGYAEKKVKIDAPLTGREPCSLKNKLWKMLSTDFNFSEKKRRELLEKLDQVLKPFEEREQNLIAQIQELEKRYLIDMEKKDEKIEGLRKELEKVQDQQQQQYAEFMEQAKKYEEKSLKREEEYILGIKQVREGFTQEISEVWKVLKNQDCKQEAQALPPQMIKTT